MDIARSLTVEQQTRHDVMAEIRVFAEQCPIGGGIIHWGATSADITDNVDVLRLREASRLLLEHLPPLAGDVLDYGCGCGVIGLFAGLRDGIRPVLSDDSALALEATRLTFAEHELEPAALVASDGFSDIEGRFDAILSNPPFHRGVGTDYAAAHALIEHAPEFLKPGGQLIVVANAFLDYPRRIEQRFGRCETLFKDRRFAIHLGRRP